MNPAALAGAESKLRPLLTCLPSSLAVRLYSTGRRRFLETMARRPSARRFSPEGLECKLWGVNFQSPITNAAGMFKNGDGYLLVARQGAGAYLAGTATHLPRRGNRQRGVFQPFAPYPRSGAASNWLGLPNVGHQKVAERLKRLERMDGCPVGVSAAACPDPSVPAEVKLEQLVAGLEGYQTAGVDFLEINESCPNTAEDPGGFEQMHDRLAFLAEHFLNRRSRVLPVVVKLSCDTEFQDVAKVVATLAELGFDGVNFGNTSIAYAKHRGRLAKAERRLFDHFTGTFGGGLSGRPLKEDSLRLVELAAESLAQDSPSHEFHVVRTGGIEEAADVRRSLDAGASLCQWYTGYFDAFAHHGHRVYRRFYRDFGRLTS